MSDDLVQQIVDCAREKWPHLKLWSASPWMEIQPRGRPIGGWQLVGWYFETGKPIRFVRITEKSAAALLAKLKET